MNLIQAISIAAAGVLALSACTVPPSAHRADGTATKVPPPTASGDAAPAAGAQDSAQGTAGTGGTEPSGAAETEDRQAQPLTDQGPTNGSRQSTTETTEGVVVLAPDGTAWRRNDEESAAYQADVESCYAYARGQVDHDARIESDVTSAFRSDSAGLGLTALRGRMSNFERSNRVPTLFNSCMTAKGYNRQY